MKLILKIFILTLNFCFLSCGQMRNVNLYEILSKSVSEFEKFPYKILFTGSEENGLWKLKIIYVNMFLLKLLKIILEKITYT